MNLLGNIDEWKAKDEEYKVKNEKVGMLKQRAIWINIS